MFKLVVHVNNSHFVNFESNSVLFYTVILYCYLLLKMKKNITFTTGLKSRFKL